MSNGDTNVEYDQANEATDRTAYQLIRIFSESKDPKNNKWSVRVVHIRSRLTGRQSAILEELQSTHNYTG